jgi:hypothetical protein
MSNKHAFMLANSERYALVTFESQLRLLISDAIGPEGGRLDMVQVVEIMDGVAQEIIDIETGVQQATLGEIVREIAKTSTERAWERPFRSPEVYGPNGIVHRSDVGRLVRDIAAEEPRPDANGFPDASIDANVLDGSQSAGEQGGDEIMRALVCTGPFSDARECPVHSPDVGRIVVDDTDGGGRNGDPLPAR